MTGRQIEAITRFLKTSCFLGCSAALVSKIAKDEIAQAVLEIQDT